jgi:hypothetical protein
MCVVTSNYEAVEKLAHLAHRYEFENLHLDMIRPRDSGDRTEQYLRSIMSRYSDMAPAFRDLVRSSDELLGVDYDVNIGNLPYCIAPDIAHKIHHEGQFTVTVAASGQGTTQAGFDKYLDKRTDKHKMESCSECVFDARCGGIFDLYEKFYGHDEFSPVNAGQLAELDEAGHHFVLLNRPSIERWEAAHAGVHFGRADERTAEFDVTVASAETARPWKLIIRAAGRRSKRQGWATLRAGAVEVAIVGQAPVRDDAIDRLRTALEGLVAEIGCEPMELAQFAALPAAWSRRQEELARIQKKRQRMRRAATVMSQGLVGVMLAGLRQSAMQRSEDGRWVEVLFRGGQGSLTLHIGIEPTEGQRGARPTLRHVVDGLTEEQVARFNAALGLHLKHRQGAVTALQ